MCGISGVYSGQFSTSNLRSTAQRMASAQAHRGPDDSGVWAEGPAALSHRRLSIIDLSEGGHQPMVSADGRYVMVFNGEIYNYRELRSQLGYPFRTQSDSEVLLAAYAQWGAACLHRLNGMFAFAVWDRQEQSLFLARDRMGIKPVYYAFENGAFCFASELRAVLASGLVQPDIDPEALTEYLRYQTVYAPRTLLKGVRMLEAGYFLKVEEVRGGEVEEVRWWGVEDYLKVEKVRSGEVERPAVRDALRRAVERRLVADVPFGAFLSGGIDSSAVVGLMAEVSASPVHTFTVTFEESAFSEAVYAAEIAKRFRTEHTEIRLSPQHFLDLLPEALTAMDHPSGDGPNTYVVSKATKAAGITMALSGLGGDELFAGYDHFKRLYRLQKMGWLNAIPQPLRQAAGAALETLRPGIPSQKISALLAAKKIDLQTAHALQRQVLLEKQIEQLTTHHSTLTTHHSTLTTPLSPILSQISSLELTTYLRHTLLRDTDQMSMAHALEVRVPFLDHELVELVLGIPDNLKYPHTPKQLLVESLGDLLPPSIVHRPKMGFTLPFERWMKQELRAFCEERLGYLGGTAYFREEAVQRLWRDFLAGKPTVTWARVWMLVVLGDWMKTNSPPAPLFEERGPGGEFEITLFYRKPRPTGNFSIETSFDRMMDAFPEGNGLKLRKFVSSYLSQGLIPRLKAALEARREQGDINHITGEVHFLALALPGRRTILTVHDLGFLRLYSGWRRMILKWFWLDWPVRHCHVVTAVSEATRQDILLHTRCRPEKVVVIPTLIGPHFHRSTKELGQGLPRILHIGMAPNKNLERHVEALAGIPCHLHILGKLQEQHHELLKHHGISYSYDFHLPDEAMQEVYAQADLLLFASTLEGFGMPILEAQTVGRPVVTSNCSSMPEVAGGAACLVDPFDVASIREGVLRVIRDAAYREELIRLGFENVKRFGAEEVARRYGKIYSSIT